MVLAELGRANRHRVFSSHLGIMRGTMRHAILIAALLVTGCGPSADQIAADMESKRWAQIEARTGKSRAEVEAEDQKILDERKAFCLKSPDARETQTKAEWSKLRSKPGVTWSSYAEYRLVVRQIKGC